MENYETYYQIKRKSNPNQYGFIVKITPNSIELLTGKNSIDLADVEINHTRKGLISKINYHYSFNQLSKKEAMVLKRKEHAWRSIQNWI